MNRLAFVLVMMKCISLAVMPVIAADYTLEIFGNANMDDTINEDDIAYVEGIIDGTNEATELADANYDGQIDEGDITQIDLIIKGLDRSLTLADSKGNIVTVTKPLDRVVALSDDAVEILKSITAEDSLVGVETRVNDNSEFFGVLSDLPSVGKWNDPDIEAILMLQPDAIICYMEYPSKDKLEDKISETIPILRFECDDPDKIDREICTLGYIFDKKEESQKLVDFYNQAVSLIEEEVSRIPEEERPSVFMEWSTDKYKSFTKGMSFDIVCSMAGGRNIVADLESRYSTKYPTLDEEWVVVQNPEFFIHMTSKTSGGYANTDPSEMKATFEEIISRSALENVTAVKHGNVYVISAWEILDTPRFFIGLIYLAKILHPEQFQDLDPMEMHEEYLARFQGIAYQGVYVYPEIGAGK